VIGLIGDLPALRLARPGIPGGLQDEAEARRVLRRAVQLGVGFMTRPMPTGRASG
jgi:hypothetical protein